MGGCGEKEEYEERVIQLLKTEPEQAGEREREREGGRERERGEREQTPRPGTSLPSTRYFDIGGSKRRTRS